MFNQLPCLGVEWNSSRCSMRRAFSGGKASYREAGVCVFRCSKCTWISGASGNARRPALAWPRQNPAWYVAWSPRHAATPSWVPETRRDCRYIHAHTRSPGEQAALAAAAASHAPRRATERDIRRSRPVAGEDRTAQHTGPTRSPSARKTHCLHWGDTTAAFARVANLGVLLSCICQSQYLGTIPFACSNGSFLQQADQAASFFIGQLDLVLFLGRSIRNGWRLL